MTRVKVRCSDRECGWSGERSEATASLLKRPRCRLYSVVVDRIPDPLTAKGTP